MDIVTVGFLHLATVVADHVLMLFDFVRFLG